MKITPSEGTVLHERYQIKQIIGQGGLWFHLSGGRFAP